MMQIGAVGIVALDAFDECRAVFGGAVRCADVAAVVIEAVESEDAGECVFLFILNSRMSQVKDLQQRKKNSSARRQKIQTIN